MTYSDVDKAELLDDLEAEMTDGKTLRQFARDHDVPYRTLYNWLNADAVTLARIARAREAQYENLAEETLAIADGTDEEPSFDVQRDKLRVDTRLKLLAKWAHARYGERQRHDHAGVKDQPITIVTGVPQPEDDSLLVDFE